MSSSKKYDFFISYSHKDKAVADELYAEIRRRKYTCFIDSDGLPAGVDWMNAIAEAILASERFVFLGSKHYYKSKNTKKELNYATQELDDNAIFPYLIDDTDMSKGIQMAIGNIHWRRYGEVSVKQFVSEIVGPEPEPEKPKEGTTQDADKPQKPGKKKPETRARYTLFTRITMSTAIVVSLLISITGFIGWHTYVSNYNVSHFYRDCMMSFGLINLGSILVFHLRKLWPSPLLAAGMLWTAVIIPYYQHTIGENVIGLRGDAVGRADMALLIVFMIGVVLLISAIIHSKDVFKEKYKYPYFPGWMWRIYRILTGKKKNSRN